MALALLKRSDADLLSPVVCDAPERLAAELSALQPFTVEVAALWTGCAGKLPLIQSALWNKLVRNGWFSVSEQEAKQLINDACKQEIVASLKSTLKADLYNHRLPKSLLLYLFHPNSEKKLRPYQVLL